MARRRRTRCSNRATCTNLVSCSRWRRFGTGNLGKKETDHTAGGAARSVRGNARRLFVSPRTLAPPAARTIGLRRGEGLERAGPWWWSAVMAGCVIDAERSGHRTRFPLYPPPPRMTRTFASTFLPRCRGSPTWNSTVRIVPRTDEMSSPPFRGRARSSIGRCDLNFSMLTRSQRFTAHSRCRFDMRLGRQIVTPDCKNYGEEASF